MPAFDPTTLALADLPEHLPLPRWSRQPGQAPLEITLRPPGSKSITNRALLLAALAPGSSTLNHPLTEADDAQRMLAAIQQLGASVDTTNPNAIKITGVSGKWKVDPNNATLDLNNAGTATRFLTAAALLADAPLTITGNARMQQRPIAELAQLLEQLGCTITYQAAQGCPPLTISSPVLTGVVPTKSAVGALVPPRAPRGGGTRSVTEGSSSNTTSISIAPTQSSQFVSALMLTAVFLPQGLTLTFPQGITSQSYVQMTLDLLDHLGAHTRAASDLSVIQIKPGLSAFQLDIEPDASGATYWWAAGALLPNATIRVHGFSNSNTSLQGDANFHTLLEQMGCTLIARDNTLAVKGTNDLRPIMCDMRDMPDAVMSLAAVACFAPGTTIVKGVKTLRVKECDRIDAMKTELAKLGVTITDNLNNDEDALSITPPTEGIDCSEDAPPIAFDTYDDHRMAMSLALLALRRPNITINDPRCVAKTYPNYFQHFAKLYR
ncbi:MAG: 3-phosphoshikimate 1-carboxyvinyltransferase [Phycisphaerales bacterium]|nr:3-phosphoshikimate 1-carboxyvinyltransferase [Phycisphaerales bacterium]